MSGSSLVSGTGLSQLGGAVRLLETVLKRQQKVSAEVVVRMLKGSKFKTVGAAVLKPQEVKVVRTCGTDSRLVL